MNTWPLDEARDKLSELIHEAREHGPQAISVRGREAAILLSVEEYHRMKRPRRSMLQILQESPLADPDVDLERQDEL